MNLKKLFKVKFDRDTMAIINKKDGLYSIIYFIFYLIMMYLFGLLMFRTSIYSYLGKCFSNKSFFRFFFYIPYIIINILPIFIILKLRDQPIKSVGIRSDNIFKSVLIGIMGSIPFSIGNVIGALNEGKTINPNLSEGLWNFLYFLLCIAFVEELVFRCFIQTRIQGLIKNKWLSIVIVGLMFGVMHIPFQMIGSNMPLVEFIIRDLSHLVNTVIIHVYLVFLYTIDKDILAPTIAHTIMNFCYEVFI